MEVLAGQELYAASNEASSTCEVIAMRAETFLQWMCIDNDFAVAVAQLLADDIGTSVKTVNRGVVKLKEAGMISLLHGKITIDKEQQQMLKDTFTEE